VRDTPLPPMSKRDVVVAVSQSGATPALVGAAAECGRQEVSVVAVTNQPGSDLGSVADVTLHCHAGPERVVAATKSVSSAMLLLRAVAVPLDDADVAEVAGQVAAPETVIEFLHGPAAAPGPVPAVVDNDDPNAPALRNHPGVVIVAPPRTDNPWLDAIVTLVTGQRMAVVWATALGRDPDAARGMAKVTPTV
jgi:fructoselysine-6-P-deglycase FrlB-like protein